MRYSWLNPPPPRPTMSRTKYDESFYYSAARLDALDRRTERVNELLARRLNKQRDAQPSDHSLTDI